MEHPVVMATNVSYPCHIHGTPELPYLKDVSPLHEVDAYPVLGEEVPLLVHSHEHRFRRLQRNQLGEGVRCLGL